ncbi:hypothetical protein [Gordonia polyisoprenivorans]|nr:hypothetical protein [Gordonia polyisoprenivorans]
MAAVEKCLAVVEGYLSVVIRLGWGGLNEAAIDELRTPLSA